MTEQEIIDKVNSIENIGGMTVNERLYVCGLTREFEECLKKDLNKAEIILKILCVDKDSIIKILYNQDDNKQFKPKFDGI